MKNKTLILAAALLCCFVLAAGKTAIGAQQTPQDLVRDFYAWYIEEIKDLRNAPITNDAIYKYVYACTVNKCRIDLKQGRVYSDYFLRGNDFDYEYAKKMLTVHAPVNITDKVSLIPVGGDLSSIVVFVQKTKEGWRIIKVEDVFQWY